MNISKLDQNYLKYKNAGIKFEFILPSILFSIISFIGILFNISLCYITIKYRKQYLIFKSNTSILLTINCFFEILHQSGNFIYLIISLSGINLIPFGKAIVYQTHSIVGFYSAVFMFNSLSIDRLFAAAFPISYQSLNKYYYIFIHLFILLLFICHIIFIIIKSALNFYYWPVNGSLSDFNGILIKENIYLSLLPFIITMTFPAIISYIFVGLIIMFKKVYSQDKMKRVYRSLFLIVCINIDKKPFYFHIFMIIPVLIINIASSSNSPILYINSFIKI
ncbi:G_PROTEIN_RECEP_F1_2 domain-containing protein [Meloidogyne graminicola]|uniref:G_PROTEIN_RECEP_F1_2 domain-containing protein n=1 Tax=Meloidogyne graminicola TaxID=189291 RepID=A0A8S9ZJI0_9BILA|nr:G_PROTEIN_RECEP_F1_2 domain-containing protein [Meloidogyne graminicola]